VARAAGVARLVLTHISARHSEHTSTIVEEAREVFPDTTVAHDGLTIELGYRDGESGTGGGEAVGEEAGAHG
jgi:ribonuclease Z